MKKNFYIWDGVYKNFDSTGYNEISQGFSSQKYLDNNLKDLLKVKNNTKYLNRFTQRYKNFDKFIIKLLSDKNIKKLKILDFGGGFGNGYLLLNKKLDKKNFKKIEYYILDIPKIIKISKKILPNVNYLDKIPNKKFDIVVSSSSIQYIDNWKKIIDKLCKLDSEYLIFYDLFIGKFKSFVTLQKYYETLIPHWFINENSFSNQITKNGYKKFKIEDTFLRRLGKINNLNMRNFNKGNRIKNTKNIIYVKNRRSI